MATQAQRRTIREVMQMTYRNKGLRGFLALLMAALMVLGTCGFAFAADALEDVEVDETILIDEPADADEAEADEPDEDDVEVVTQNEKESRTVTVTMYFTEDNGVTIILNKKVIFRLWWLQQIQTPMETIHIP